jgi:hypothetical protein
MPATHAAEQANSTNSLRKKGMRLPPPLPLCAAPSYPCRRFSVVGCPSLSLELHGVRSMSSRADYYRIRGFEAQQWAGQTSEEKMKDAFRDVAAGWFMLAELTDCFNDQGQPADKH